MISAEQVIKRNRRCPMPPRGLELRLARATEPRRRGLARGHWQGIAVDGPKQPGRRFGPQPWGPDVPKKNKVIDKDGNARIAPMTEDRRRASYLRGRDFMSGDALTSRQRRRRVHKRNHLAAPFGKKATD